MSKTYLALTIGPIYKTIQRARKTRELWAASFLLSLFMKKLLTALKIYSKEGKTLSPNIATLGENTKYHGAGIWNDNCYLEVEDGKLEAMKAALPGIIKKTKEDIIDLALFAFSEKESPLSEDELRSLLRQHFHCHAVLFSSADQNVQMLKQLSTLTASAEMRDLFPSRHDDFVSEVLFRGAAIWELYREGFDPFDKVFTYFNGKRDKRLPSLLEIGVREFRNQEVYDDIENIISEKIRLKKDETDEENQEIIQKLKNLEKINGKSQFKKRHKYLAIVQSDGDGVGNLIQSETDSETIKTLSAKLMAFSKAAVDKIVGFDGLPVYAGGDDLLFIAPLRNSEKKNIFDLIKQIQGVYAAQELPSSTSLSFGISIFYYKYPLGEAIENGRELLNKLSKKLAFQKKGEEIGFPTVWDEDSYSAKNALSFRVMLHAGQSFAAVMRQDGDSFNLWKALLETHESVQSDAAFVSGVIHTLERLEWLLEQACIDGTTEYFFKHHFNEAKGKQEVFIQRVRELAEAIFEEYGALFPPDKKGKSVHQREVIKFFRSQLELREEDFPDHAFSDPQIQQKLLTKFRSNLLYSALRIIQFLNADDHE